MLVIFAGLYNNKPQDRTSLRNSFQETIDFWVLYLIDYMIVFIEINKKNYFVFFSIISQKTF